MFRKLRGFFSIAAVLLLILSIGACTKQNSGEVEIKRTSGGDSEKAIADIDLSKRGRATYMAHCIACHNVDPKQSGALGPDVYGSSRELLEARILKAEYPEGYKPKKPGQTMVAMPFLKNDLNALFVYLNMK